jgi:hypothetical protein
MMLDQYKGSGNSLRTKQGLLELIAISSRFPDVMSQPATSWLGWNGTGLGASMKWLKNAGSRSEIGRRMSVVSCFCGDEWIDRCRICPWHELDANAALDSRNTQF